MASVAEPFNYRAFRRDGAGVVVRQVPRTKADATSVLDSEALINTRRFCQDRNGEVFFARAVILAEGDTEAAALPVFARAHWGRSHDELGVSIVGVDGDGGKAAPVAHILDRLGIPWFVLLDGDKGWEPGIRGLSKALDRAVDETAPEVVRLMSQGHGVDIEEYLYDLGFEAAMARAIAKQDGPQALSEFKRMLDGERRKKDQTRDYHSTGWERRLTLDYFRKRGKGSLSREMADQIVISIETEASIFPPLITELFRRVDVRLSPTVAP